MKTLKRMTAAACALCLCAVYPAYGGFTGGLSTSAEDISNTMEWGALRIGGGGFVSGLVAGKGVMFARTDVGGAYKYNYETESWEQLLGFLNEADKGLLSVDAMAVDPTDDDTAYFLCGCVYFSDARTEVFKTTDGGKTFTRTDVTDLIQVHGNGNGRQFGESIAVDPDDPNVIYAGGDVSKNGTGLIKSTDGGKTWEAVTGYSDLEFDTGTEKRHYFEYTIHWPWYASPQYNNPELFSMAATTSVDGEGPSYTQNGVSAITVLGGKVYVATSVLGIPNIVVADTSKDEFKVFDDSLPTDLYPSRLAPDGHGNLLITYTDNITRSGGSGKSYRYNPETGVLKDISPCEKGIGEIFCDPNNENKLIASTCGLWSGQSWNSYGEEAVDTWGDWFYRSYDGGDTWENVTPGAKAGKWGEQYYVSEPLLDGGYKWIRNKAIHWCCSIVIDPRNSDKVLMTSGNGVFACDNIWDEKGVQFYFHPDGIEEVVALDFVSTTDGLDLSAIGDYDGFVHEKVDEIGLQYKPNMGSTSAIAVCPQNTDVWARIAEGDNGAGYYTTDRGKTWNAFTPSTKGGKLAIAQIKKDTYRIFNTGKEDGGVSYSDDWGETWNKCDGIPSQYGSKPTMLLVEPDDPNTVYAYATYYNSSWHYSKTEPDASDAQYKFCVSTDGGKTFTSTDICMYDQCDSAGRIAYLEKGHVILGGGWYGMYDVKIDGTKVTSTKLENISYCKTVGYGAPEKEGGLNTLYMYGKPQDSDPEGIYRSTDGGKNWDCINTDHIYGGTGNGNFLVGDMDEFGKVYMSTVGCGIVYGVLSDAPDKPQPSTDEKPTEAPTGKVLYGDANEDKNVTISDAVAVLQSLANSEKYGLTKQGALNADCVDNGNGVTGHDAAGIQLVDAGVVAQEKLPIKSSDL
ncbi:MAG: 1,4-beta-glucanase [Ruminococcus sp.]|nr:1,4-beta-glucanase [Ruminococcus sp.]